MQHNPGFLKLTEEARKRIKECTVGDIQAKLTQGIQFHFIDVREDHEFLIDHAAGACHLSKGIIERDIESVKYTDYIVLRWRLSISSGGRYVAVNGL